MNVKVLYCASTTSHLKNFHLPYFKWLSENGCEVVTLTDDGQKLPHTSRSEKVRFTKKLWSLQNVAAIFEVRQILKSGQYALVITNTTLASDVVRAAIILLPQRERPKVLRIAHGFEFHENERLRKWLFLIPELICARITDVFAVMNHESECIVKRYKLGRSIVFTHGIGLDIDRFYTKEPMGDIFKFIYAAEFSKRKNQTQLIKAFAHAIERMPDARLVFAGDGVTLAECKQQASSLQIDQYIDFLGYVNDIPNVLAGCDAAVSSSRYEGLPFNIMEAMASGLPIIASDIAGHRDLLEESSLYRSESELADKLLEQYKLGKRRVAYQNMHIYSLENVMKEWTRILEELITVSRLLRCSDHKKLGEQPKGALN